MNFGIFSPSSKKKKNKDDSSRVDDDDEISRQTNTTSNVTSRRVPRVSADPDSQSRPSNQMSYDEFSQDIDTSDDDHPQLGSPPPSLEIPPIPFAEQFPFFGTGDATISPRNIGHAYHIHYTHADRSKMKIADALDFQAEATKGIKHPIKAVSLHDTLTDTRVDKNSKTITSLLNQQENLLSLKKRIHHYGLQDALILIPTIDKPGCIPDFEIDKNNTDRISIIDSWRTTTLQEVQRSCQIRASTHCKYTQQDLSFSRDMILSSFDGTTRSDTQGKIKATNALYMDQGLAAFYFAMKRTFVEEPIALHELNNLVRTIKPQDFPGENINKMVHQLQIAIHILERNNCKPPDMVTIIIKSFLLCTVLGFTTHIQTLKSIKSPIIDDDTLLLAEGSRLYEEINLVDGGWTAKSHKPVSYKAEHQGRQQRTVPPPGDSKTCIPIDPTSKPRREVDITPPGPGQPSSRTRADGKTEIWCTRPRCCIEPQEGKTYSRPGKWVTHPDTDEGHKQNWEFADKKTKERLAKKAAYKQKIADKASRGDANVAHSTTRPTIATIASDPESDTDNEPVNHPQAHHASWWVSAYLN